MGRPLPRRARHKEAHLVLALEDWPTTCDREVRSNGREVNCEDIPGFPKARDEGEG